MKGALTQLVSLARACVSCPPSCSAYDVLILESTLLFQCEPCGDGTYSLEFGSSNGTAGAVKPITCHPCGNGGICQAGAVVPAAGHWGAASEVTGVVQFTPCPTG